MRCSPTTDLRHYIDTDDMDSEDEHDVTTTVAHAKRHATKGARRRVAHKHGSKGVPVQRRSPEREQDDEEDDEDPTANHSLETAKPSGVAAIPASQKEVSDDDEGDEEDDEEEPQMIGTKRPRATEGGQFDDPAPKRVANGDADGYSSSDTGNMAMFYRKLKHQFGISPRTLRNRRPSHPVGVSASSKPTHHF